MKQLIALLTLAMPLLAVDLSIERNGDCVRVFTTNQLPRCALLQFNRTLATNTWFGYYRFSAENSEPSMGFSFKVKANEKMVFWRLKDCAVP